MRLFRLALKKTRAYFQETAVSGTNGRGFCKKKHKRKGEGEGRGKKRRAVLGVRCLLSGAVEVGPLCPFLSNVERMAWIVVQYIRTVLYTKARQQQGKTEATDLAIDGAMLLHSNF